MGLDGRLSDEQAFGDLGVRQSGCHEAKDVEFSFSQVGCPDGLSAAEGRVLGLDEVLDQPTGDRGSEECIAAGDGADGVGELPGRGRL